MDGARRRCQAGAMTQARSALIVPGNLHIPTHAGH